MYIAKIVGTLVSTRKDDSLIGHKILIVQPLDEKLSPQGHPEVAVDSVGAGVGEIVLIASGSPAARVFNKPNSPIDRAVVGIIDSIEANL